MTSFRGSVAITGLGVIPIVFYLKTTYYDPKFTEPAKQKVALDLLERDREASENLFYNKFGAPTRPSRSLDDLIYFLAGSGTYDQLADFVSYTAAMDINMDMQKGLDGIMSDEDSKMLAYYKASLKKGGH